jgi:hypothetical protein
MQMTVKIVRVRRFDYQPLFRPFPPVKNQNGLAMTGTGGHTLSLTFN